MHLGAHCARLLGAAFVALRSIGFRGELQRGRMTASRARQDRAEDRGLARAELLLALQHPLAGSDLLPAAIAGTGLDHLAMPRDEPDFRSIAPACIEDGSIEANARPRFGDF